MILLLRGICTGETSAQIAPKICRKTSEAPVVGLNITRQTVLKMRRAIQDRALAIQPDSPLPMEGVGNASHADEQTETDEMFQNAGEKRNSSKGRKCALSSQS